MSIPSVKAALSAALRDFKVDGLPASGANDPAKLALRAALLSLADLTVSSGTTLVFATRALLEASPDPDAVGARAEVRADPAGDVEDGNGVWSWSGAEWVWVSGLLPEGVVEAVLAEVPQPVVDCSITHVGALITYTPKPGYSVVPGARQIFTGVSPFTNGGNVYVEVIGFNGGDHRQIVPLGALELPEGSIRAGELAPISFNAAGRFTLQTAAPSAAPAVIGQAVVECDIEAEGPALTLTESAGYTIFATGLQTLTGIAPFTNAGAVYADVAVITGGDFREVVLPGGDELPAGSIREGEFMALRYNGSSGRWLLVSAPAASAGGDGDLFTHWAAAGAAALALNGRF